MNHLTEKLLCCSECGSKPKIHEAGDDYKLFCSECSVHNSSGDWFPNKYEACHDWNRRQKKNTWSSDKNLGELLRTCPFCGRNMKFYRTVAVGCNGEETHQYYMHEDMHEDYKGDECILDTLSFPFTINADDADPENGFIGVNAKLWNKRKSVIF